MNIQSLHYFTILAKCKNFTAAAKECNITQPAFSRRIKALEEELDIKLTVRGNNSFKLTSAGERLLLQATEIIRNLEQLKDNLHDESRSEQQTVHITMMNSISMAQSGLIHSSITRIAPHANVKYTVRSVYDGLELLKKKRTDLLLCYASDWWAPSADQNLYGFRTIGTETAIPVCHADYFYDLNKDCDTSIPVLDHSPSTVIGLSINRMLESKEKRNFNYATESDHSCTLYNMILHKHEGICWLPKSIVASDIARGTIIHLGDGKWDFHYDIRLYINSKNTNTLANTIADTLKI